MNSRMGAGIAVTVVLMVALFMFVMQQRALRAELEARQQQQLQQQQQSRPVEKARATDFQGKVVYVETSNGFSVPLFDARVKEASGRSFVVGQPPNGIEDGGIYAHSTLWLPLSEVTRMSEFADMEVLRNNRKLIRAHQMEQLKAPPR